MFSYRGLFLAVTVSLASIVLADVLVQPGYDEHRYNSNQRYSQHQPVQYQMQSPVVQYRAQQLPDQESTRYLSGVQTVYPYSDSQDNARSHLVRYPHRPPYHHYHYLSRPNHLHYAKIGGHGYVRPSVFLGYPQPLTVHNRYKRSDPTSTESRKSEIAAHDNDVAAKSPLTDAEHPTAIDSLLPEHEPTDINDKRVENRQINDDHVTKPRLFGLYPEKMYSEHRSADNPYTYSMHGMLEDTISRINPKPEDMYDNMYDNMHIISNRPSIQVPLPPMEKSDDNDDDYRSKYRDANTNPSLYDIIVNNMRYYWPGTYGIYIRDAISDMKRRQEEMQVGYTDRTQQRDAHQEHEKKSLHTITNMDMISTAQPRNYYDSKLPILSDSPKESVPKMYHCIATSDAAVTVQPQQQYVQNQYRNNKESGTDEIVGTPYFDRNGRFPNYYSYYSNNYYPNYYSNDDSDEYSNNADFHIDLNKRNSNSTNSIEPPIKVSDYVLRTNARNNPLESLATLLNTANHMYFKPDSENKPILRPSYSYVDRIPMYVPSYASYL